ncbi:MAG: rod shape-determining protein MreC [Candidatus Nealsonbacteria bacterium]|nr:rod shape-determining protein MreC [Candidatus Nealsonbacteria bacterium]
MRGTAKRKKILVVIIGIALIFSLNFFQSEIKSFFYNISLPIQKLFWPAPKNQDEVRRINLELMSEIIELQKVIDENAVMRDALGIGLEKEFDLEMAEVIGKDINRDSVFIDRGSNDGLSKDMPVINQQKVLLGKISEVYSYRSRVTLISDKSSSFDAEVFGGVSGLLSGRGGGKISLELLPKNEEIKEGSLVISSALGGIFPSGLLIGTIQTVKKNDIEPFQAAEVSPFSTLNTLKQVFIILNF